MKFSFRCLNETLMTVRTGISHYVYLRRIILSYRGNFAEVRLTSHDTVRYFCPGQGWTNADPDHSLKCLLRSIRRALKQASPRESIPWREIAEYDSSGEGGIMAYGKEALDLCYRRQPHNFPPAVTPGEEIVCTRCHHALDTKGPRAPMALYPV